MPWDSTVRTAMRATGWAAMRTLPSRRHVAVHGWPDSEGNSLEVLRALCRRYPGDVVWLLNDEQAQFVTGVMLPIDGGFLSSPGI